MPNLNDTLTHKTGNYIMNIHYKYFTINIVTKNRQYSSKKELFLTYNGMLKVLFSSKTGNADNFQKWATETLFTVHLGSQEQKDILASSLIGVNSRAIKDVFRTNTDKIPSIYLYIVGKSNDDNLICKYGFTDDLPRRNEEHSKTYKKEFNQDIELFCFSIIEPKWLSDAETQIKHYFEGYKFEYKQFKELVIINKKQLNQVKDFYSMIQKSFIGRYVELSNKIKDLEYKLLQEEHKNELKDKDNKLLQEQLHTNNEINALKVSLLNEQIKLKDNELLTMKLYIAELGNIKESNITNRISLKSL